VTFIALAARGETFWSSLMLKAPPISAPLRFLPLNDNHSNFIG